MDKLTPAQIVTQFVKGNQRMLQTDNLVYEINEETEAIRFFDGGLQSELIIAEDGETVLAHFKNHAGNMGWFKMNEDETFVPMQGPEFGRMTTEHGAKYYKQNAEEVNGLMHGALDELGRIAENLKPNLEHGSDMNSELELADTEPDHNDHEPLA